MGPHYHNHIFNTDDATTRFHKNGLTNVFYQKHQIQILKKAICMLKVKLYTMLQLTITFIAYKSMLPGTIINRRNLMLNISLVALFAHWKLFMFLLHFSQYSFFSALAVRFVTRRFIWDYDPTLGKLL